MTLVLLVAITTATFAWYTAGTAGTKSGSENSATISTTDPGVVIGTDQEFQVVITEVLSNGSNGSRGNLHFTAYVNTDETPGADSLVEYYLDAAGAPHPVTDNGTEGTDWAAFLIFKIEIKAPEAGIDGEAALALRNTSIKMSVGNKEGNESTVCYQGPVALANIGNLDGKVANTATSISNHVAYEFAAGYTGSSSSELLATWYIAIRIDGGATTGTGLEANTGSGDFTVTLS